MTTAIEYLWIFFSLTGFLTGAYWDLKQRVIPDKVWLIQLLGGSAVSIWWFISAPGLSLIIVAITNLVFSLIFGLVSFITGALGGGDVKAIFVLSLSYPITVQLTSISWQITQLFPPVFYLISNWLVIMLVYALYLLLNNLLSIAKYGELFQNVGGTAMDKFNLLISGNRISVNELKDGGHFQVAEQFLDGKWVIHTPLFEGAIEDEKYDRREKQHRRNVLQNLDKKDTDAIWVRPEPPGLVFMTISLLFLVLVGSPLGFFFSFILGL